MRKYFIFIVSFFNVIVYAQTLDSRDHFNVEMRVAEGNLNNDCLLDKAIVTCDTTDDTRPLRLQIFFGQADSSFKLMVSTNHLIEAQYPAELGGEHNGNTTPNFYIEDGKLQMECYINGMSIHTFHYQNNHFELIEFEMVKWDGEDKTTCTSLNLRTGTFKKSHQLLGSDEVFIDEEKNLPVNVLPRIDDFKLFQTEIY